MIDMSEMNIKMFKDAEDARGVIEINQIMNEMITKVDNIMTLDNIQKSKDTEFKIMEQLQEHNANIKNSIELLPCFKTAGPAQKNSLL